MRCKYLWLNCKDGLIKPPQKLGCTPCLYKNHVGARWPDYPFTINEMWSVLIISVHDKFDVKERNTQMIAFGCIVTIRWRYWVPLLHVVMLLTDHYAPCPHRTSRIVTNKWNKQRVLMHRHQGLNVRHGLCHIYLRYLYIYICCL